MILYLILSLYMNSGCHKVMQISELKGFLANESKTIYDFDEQLSRNQSFVFFLKTGKVLMLESSLLDTGRGVLFEKRDCYDSFLLHDHIPLEEDVNSIEEKFQSYILSLNIRSEEIIFSLAKRNNVSANSLSALLDKIKANSNASLDDAFASGIALGELVRRAYNGRWLLLKEYGRFNSYFTPAILYPDNSVLILSDKLGLFFDNSEVTADNFIKLPSIANPNHNLSRGLPNRFSAHRLL